MDVFVARVASIIVAGCLGFVAAQPSCAQVATERVVLQLSGDPQFRFAGYYAALWQGYYAEAGLDVTLRAALTADGRRLDPTAEVAAGRATFGVGEADILIARDQGAPLIVVASVFPQSAGAFYALAESGIGSPADFVGRRIARRPGDPLDAQLQALLRWQGIDLDDVTGVAATATPLADLAEGRVDLVPGNRLSLPFEAMQQGLALREIRPEAYGAGFAGDSLFTHEGSVLAHPRMVDAFREASLRGWQYALRQPHEIARRLAASFPRDEEPAAVDARDAFQAARIAAMLAGDGALPGAIDAAQWQGMQAELAEAGVIREAELAAGTILTVENQIERELLWWRRATLAASLFGLGALVLAVAGYVARLRQNVHRSRTLLARSRWQLALTVDVAREGLFQWWPDADSVRCDWGRHAATPPLHRDVDGLVSFLAVIAPGDREGVAAALHALAVGSDAYAELEFRVGEGESAPWFLLRCGVPPDTDRPQAVYGVLVDITRLKRAEQAMERLAMEDPLTGLGNRRCFDDALARATAKADRRDAGVVVALIDLDGFKPINDRYGHDHGDEVLRIVARRLLQMVRAGDVVARFGGDEFALVVEDMAAVDVEPWAARLLRELGRPMVIDGHVLSVRASMGWTRYPDDASSTASLVRHADTALYQAKAAGGASQAAFTPPPRLRKLRTA